MGSYINPFDAPLQSEIQEHQQAQAATLKASPTGNPFDEPLMSEKAEAAMTGSDTGAITNDVGNAVIMPKEGESFDETLRRAAAYGRTVAPQQTNAEMATLVNWRAEQRSCCKSPRTLLSIWRRITLS